MSETNLRSVIQNEFLKSAVDPVHFFKKYAKIQHPMRGKILFNLYPFQEDALRQFRDNRNNIVLKSRQMGISTLVAGHALHQMLFNDDFKILVIATKQDVAKNLVQKVQTMWEFLPSFLTHNITIVNKNKLSLSFSNGSEIKAVSSSPDAARSEALSLLVLDEFAFVECAEEIWTAAHSTLSTGGSCIMLSTPNGIGNVFHETWQKAVEGTTQEGMDPFNPIMLPWYLHPERDQTWRDNEDIHLGKRLASQECFTGETLIYTSKGLKRIDSIVIGDSVLTHTGKFEPVTKLYSHESNDIYSIKTVANNNEIFVTGNHPIMVKDRGWVNCNEIKDTDFVATFLNNRNIHFNEAVNTIDLFEIMSPKYFKKVLSDDISFYINDRKHKRIHKRFIDVDYDLGFILGLYLAEGSGNRLRKTYAFNYETEIGTWIPELVLKLDKVFGIKDVDIRTFKDSKLGHLNISSEVLCWTIDSFVDGKNCYTKSLSDFFWKHANKESLKGILDGYMIGDGMIRPKYDIMCTSKSEKLINDVQYISNLLGLQYIRRELKHATNEIKNNFNRDYLDVHDTHLIHYKNTKGHDVDVNKMSSILPELVMYDRKKRYYISDEYIYSKCTIKKTDKKEVVYNLEVENDHTYITSHFVVHNCDADFLSSGHTVIEGEILQWYEKEQIKNPIEKRGIGGDYWIWSYPDPSRNYIVSADVARGDGADYSTFHVIDVESVEQVAEFKGKIDTQIFGNLLVSVSTEYNNAVLVVDNRGVGWDTLQVIMNSGYKNLHYSYRNDPYLDEEVHLKKGYDLKKKEDMVAGYTITPKNRPVLVSKLDNYLSNKHATIHSYRLLHELQLFIWLNGKPQAVRGKNDDLVMAFCMALMIRDTALKLRTLGIGLAKRAINATHKSVYKAQPVGQASWEMNIGKSGQKEDLKWLL